jgi:hypothetical protein
MRGMPIPGSTQFAIHAFDSRDHAIVAPVAGHALFAAGKAKAALTAYERMLDVHRRDVQALRGVERAGRAAARGLKAKTYVARLAEPWRDADISPSAAEGWDGRAVTPPRSTDERRMEPRNMRTSMRRRAPREVGWFAPRRQRATLLRTLLGIVERRSNYIDGASEFDLF